MLRDAEFQPFYTSGEDHEPSEFLFDGLMQSHRFDLGLGYFRSSGFSTLAIGFASFLKNGGTMRFIINDSLAEKDKVAILQGAQADTDADYEKELLRDLETLTKTLTKRNAHFFNCLAWLISSERLEIIAVVPKNNKVGIVHHKFGIFTDVNGDQAAFNGSLNFSQYALNNNVESIWCEVSWDAHGMAGRRIAEMIRLFENTWSGNSKSVRIIPLEDVKTAIFNKFPKKTIKELVEEECELAKEVIEFPGTSPEYKAKLERMVAELIIDDSAKPKIKVSPLVENEKWLHQSEAIRVFMEHERGVLNMATGTGKTRTSLKIFTQLAEKGAIDTLVIACDGTDLLNQWYKELLKTIARENLRWAIVRQYDEFHQSEKFRNNPQLKILLSSRQQLDLSLKLLTPEQGARTLLIHDEVHKLGSEGNRNRLGGLSDKIRYRLGLSATPERVYDADGTAFIIDHIGPVIFEFTLENAIRRGILAPFNYFPVPYELSADDKSRLQGVYRKKAARAKAGNPMRDEEFYNDIAHVYKTAEGKVPAFRDFISQHTEMLDQCIIFVETKLYGETILDIVHGYHTDFHTYFGEDDAEVLKRFSQGNIGCLLTCHRLSEGIDIQSLKNVILLASSKTRLETIQRIGRCLRTDPNDPLKVANVIDFIRVSENEESINADGEREQFLQALSNIRPDNLS